LCRMPTRLEEDYAVALIRHNWKFGLTMACTKIH
jgi:hypothetical protein